MDFARAKPERRGQQLRLLGTFRRTDRASGGAKPTEVCQLQLSSLVDQQVLGLQVSVEDFPPMTVGQTAEQLEKKQLQGETKKKQIKPEETSEKSKGWKIPSPGWSAKEAVCI